MIPPRPQTTEGRGSVLRFARAFRRDLLSALPERLYRAWMAEFRSPLVHSFFCNDPALVRLILKDRPQDFPKSNRLRTGLAPLLGASVFVTNGPEWAAQRRIIDPAFDGGRLHDTLPAIFGAADAMVARLKPGPQDIEPEASHAAADVIFRAMFSMPIEHETAERVFAAFRAHQDAQPVVNWAALLPWPRWLPHLHSRRTRRTAGEIRSLIAGLVKGRMDAIRVGGAPDDLATRIMTTPDPQTGRRFSEAEMVDQVAIFFLAGHETSASALAWALWLLAAHPEWQKAVAAEAASLTPDMAGVKALRTTRAVFREALRLYPPVPMMVRQAARSETLRGRRAPPGAQLVLSPWHLHRHVRLWDRPDEFDPARWHRPETQNSARDAFIPFSAGQRVCPGAGLAMVEGVVMLARIAQAFHLRPGPRPPTPVARLTVRGRDGITIHLAPRNSPA
ncbi:cytochrome P450 [Paracoccus acridae]|uniref:Cytochrome P450 n=1 Tax=Paracoccus acridae TaxID=1795310 RepID=A0ABQ1VGK1_9RHOB|nr:MULTISPECIES: cytochrome P450 [Paracoccus]GGF63713.1 cytochrome P450 [Paracoccus acridae]